MSSNNQNLNAARILLVTTLALSQCWMLSACGRKAALVGAKSAVPGGVTAPETLAKQNPPLTPGAAANANPNLKPSTAAPGPTTFAESLTSVEFDVDAKSDVVRSGFTYYPSNLIGPIVAKISAATAPTGVDMGMPVGVTELGAHLICDKADCSSAQLTLFKRKAPLEGQASIQVISTVPATVQTFTQGTPADDLQAKIASALLSQENRIMQTQILKVSQGATFFKFDCRFPQGAIVPGQPPSDKGRRVTVSGLLGGKATITMSFSDTESTNPTTTTHKDYEGKATYSETDKTIHLKFDGSNRITSLDFGNFSNAH